MHSCKVVTLVPKKKEKRTLGALWLKQINKNQPTEIIYTFRSVPFYELVFLIEVYSPSNRHKKRTTEWTETLRFNQFSCAPMWDSTRTKPGSAFCWQYCNIINTNDGSTCVKIFVVANSKLCGSKGGDVKIVYNLRVLQGNNLLNVLDGIKVKQERSEYFGKYQATVPLIFSA